MVERQAQDQVKDRATCLLWRLQVQAFHQRQLSRPVRYWTCGLHDQDSILDR